MSFEKFFGMLDSEGRRNMIPSSVMVRRGPGRANKNYSKFVCE